MATPVDQLIIEIKAETAGLRKGLDDVNKKLNVANKTARASVLTFGNLARIFAAVGFARLIKGVIDTTRTFEDLRATLQANTGDITETNDAFKLILDFTKTTTFQIDQVTRAFIEFRRLGISPTREQLKGIGNVAAANSQSIDQLASNIFKAGTTSIEGLQAIGVTAKTEGDKMTISLGGITKVIDKNVQSVLEFVAEVGNVKFPDAIQQRAETLTGALSNLGDRVSIFQNEIGEAGLKDSLNDLVQTFNDLLLKGGQSGLTRLLGSVLSGAVDILNTALIKLEENAGKVKLALIGIAAVVSVMVAQSIFASMAAGVAVLTTAMNTLRTAIQGARKAFVGLMIIAALNPVAAATMGITAVAGGAAFVAFGDEIEAALTQTIQRIDDALEAAGGNPQADTGDGGNGGGKKPTITKRLADLASLRKEIANRTVAIQDMARAQEILNKEVADGNISQEAANALYREFLETTGQFGKSLAQIGREVEGLASSFSDDLTTALMNGESALESFKNFAFNVVQSVISAFLELMVIQPIVDAILGAFSISTPKGGTGSRSRGAPSGAGFAGGGTVQRGTPTIVGERGAEIFVPNTGGTIMNNMNSMNAMGGTPIIVNQSVNFSTGVVPTVRAEVTKMLPQISDVTKGAVLEAAVRGGSFRKGLMGNG